MLDFFKNHKFKIILIILALLFGMMLYSASTDGVKNIPKNLLSMITYPFQKAASVISTSVGGFFDDIGDYKDALEENKELKEEISKLQKQLIHYEEIKDENLRLKNLQSIKDEYEDINQMVGASVISRDPNDRFSSFLIDKGTLHGISKNDPVISNSGLIGIVSEVGPINARVITILSPELSVGVMENVSAILGVLKGDTTLTDEGYAKMTILSNAYSLSKNDMIITAGSSSLFPKGIPVGKIADIKTEESGVTKYAEIDPFVDIKNIKNVYVITDFLGQGSSVIE